MRWPTAPKGNGGRHCCQPPLRRAKDLPVFVTWFQNPKAPKPALDPGSPAQASLPIKSLPREESRSTYLTARPEGSLVFRSSGLALEPRSSRTGIPRHKAIRCFTALLGVTALASRFAHQPQFPTRRTRSGAASR